MRVFVLSSRVRFRLTRRRLVEMVQTDDTVEEPMDEGSSLM